MKKPFIIAFLIAFLQVLSLSSCQDSSLRASSSSEEWIQTPIPLATIIAYPDKQPVMDNKQAVIAARNGLLSSRINLIGDPKVISVDFIPYSDAIVRMNAKEENQNDLNEKVWLVQFEGKYTVAFPSSDGAMVSEFGLVFVLLEPEGGIRVTWGKLDEPYPADLNLSSGYPTPENGPPVYPVDFSTRQAIRPLAPAFQNTAANCTPLVITKIVTATQTQSTPGVKNTAPPTGVPPGLGDYSLILEKCSRDECLFREDIDYPVGVAVITGYYKQIERGGFGEQKTCDSFIIIGGSSEIIRSILALIDETGNRVYLKNDLNQPIISLDIEELENPAKDTLTSSSPDNLVDLLILAHPPVPMGAPICFTRFEILSVLSHTK